MLWSFSQTITEECEGVGLRTINNNIAHAPIVMRGRDFGNRNPPSEFKMSGNPVDMRNARCCCLLRLEFCHYSRLCLTHHDKRAFAYTPVSLVLISIVTVYTGN